MILPPVTLVRQLDTHRLVPSRHLSGDKSVLAAIAGEHADLSAIVDLDAATNDRLLAHERRLPGIGLEELVFAVPHHVLSSAPAWRAVQWTGPRCLVCRIRARDLTERSCLSQVGAAR